MTVKLGVSAWLYITESTNCNRDILLGKNRQHCYYPHENHHNET